MGASVYHVVFTPPPLARRLLWWRLQGLWVLPDLTPPLWRLLYAGFDKRGVDVDMTIICFVLQLMLPICCHSSPSSKGVSWRWGLLFRIVLLRPYSFWLGGGMRVNWDLQMDTKIASILTAYYIAAESWDCIYVKTLMLHDLWSTINGIVLLCTF